MVKITGRKIELSGEVIAGDYAYYRKIPSLEMATKINPNEYVLIQEGDEVSCAMSMGQSFGRKNHLDTIVDVLRSGLFVPRTKLFMTQYANVNRALERRGVLYDAEGNLIEGERLIKYAQMLNHDCWAHLNDSFKKGEGFLGLDVVYAIEIDSDGKLVFGREPLQPCLEKNCFADLASVNEQGFPTREYPFQKYEIGKSIYFSSPLSGCVAWFGADSDGAFLYCDRVLTFSYYSLGVFPCVNGVAEK